MSIPELDQDGLLPSGVHPCTLADLRDRFGKFQTTDRRCRLCEQFKAYFKELQGTGLIVAIIVDGSFVTGKHDPNDIDLILVLPSGHDFSAGLRPNEYNVLSRRQVARRYGIDVLLARESGPELAEYIEFFAQLRDEADQRKGLLKVTL